MADLVANTQVLSSAKRIPDARYVNLLDAPRAVISNPVGVERRSVPTNGSAQLGGINEFSLPSALIGEMYLEFVFSAPSSGNYTRYVALCAVESVDISCGSNTLDEFRYQPVMRSLMQKMSKSKSDYLLEVAGSTTPPTGEGVVTMIPTFFSSIQTAFTRATPPLDCRNTRGLTVRVTTAPLADLLDAGASGGGLSSLRLHYYTFADAGALTPQSSYFGTSWATLPRSSSHTNGATVLYDIKGFPGKLHEICIHNTLVTDISTAHDPYKSAQDLSQVEMLIDGKSYFKSSGSNQLQLDALLLADNCEFADGPSYVIPFSSAGSNNNVLSGFLDMNHVQSLSVEIKQDAGAATYIDFAAQRKCEWYVQYGCWVQRL